MTNNDRARAIIARLQREQLGRGIEFSNANAEACVPCVRETLDHLDAIEAANIVPAPRIDLLDHNLTI